MQWTALIAAARADLRESLRAMLVSIQPDAVILETDDVANAERLLHEHHPNLIVIDADLQAGRWIQLVRAAAAERPRIRCSILVNTVSQQAAAMKAGADHAPFKGEPPSRLFTQVEHLMQLH